eukprot:1159621-Pelagomonas_calceolata.AAC.12
MPSIRLSAFSAPSACLLHAVHRSLLALGGNQTSTVNDLVAALYLVTGRISPAYEHGGELNIGGSTVGEGRCLS